MNCYFIFIYCTHCWTVSKKVNHMLTTLYSLIKFLESLSIQLYSVILLVSSVPHTIMTLEYHKFTTALRKMHFFVLAKNPKMKSMFMIYSQFNCRYVFLNNIETFINWITWSVNVQRSQVKSSDDVLMLKDFVFLS